MKQALHNRGDYLLVAHFSSRTTRQQERASQATSRVREPPLFCCYCHYSRSWVEGVLPKLEASVTAGVAVHMWDLSM